MHLSADFGNTVKMIEEDGFPISQRVEMLLPSDSPESIAKSMGRGVTGFAEAFGQSRPDILIVLGDRFEMHSAALAALPFKIPVAHIHGGELTEGAIDDALRHSITKLSHLHFVSTDEHARRVIQLGEEPWRVTNCGALGLDNLRSIRLLDKDELENKYALNLESPPLLVTFHPATLDDEEAGEQAEELFSAVENSGLPAVFTLPNADTGGRAIGAKTREFVKHTSRAWMVDNFGTQGYFSMMRLAAAMVGNSSSGIIEAASFKLPVVNVGDRQGGRIRGANVIDVSCHRKEISNGIAQAVTTSFRESLSQLVNPYGSGHAAPAIVEKLKTVTLDQKLIVKRFHDVAMR
jgi:UDP-hydrolysing UDP-N-acetyl-D-glucosamine 2-epimerase